MGIIQEMLTQDHEKKQTIDRKVSEQHIMPTQGEQQKANDVIRIISEKYAEKLKNHSIQDIEDELIEAIRKECEGLDLIYEEQKRIEKTVIITALGQGPIEEYLRDPNITEIVVQRFDNVVIERNGKIESVKAVFFNEEHLVNTIERIVQSADRQINQSVPIADAKLADGSRVNATIPPVTPDGATLTMARMDDGSYNIALKGTKTLSFDFQNVDDFINQTEAPEGHTFDEKDYDEVK